MLENPLSGAHVEDELSGADASEILNLATNQFLKSSSPAAYVATVKHISQRMFFRLQQRS
jgi:hypothetical protein